MHIEILIGKTNSSDWCLTFAGLSELSETTRCWWPTARLTRGSTCRRPGPWPRAWSTTGYCSSRWSTHTLVMIYGRSRTICIKPWRNTSQRWKNIWKLISKFPFISSVFGIQSIESWSNTLHRDGCVEFSSSIEQFRVSSRSKLMYYAVLSCLMSTSILMLKVR